MGKAFQGVYGSFQGKVGNVVGRVRQGVQVYSIYQPSVANPQTTEQMKYRQAFSLMSKFCSAIIAFLRVGFHALDGYKYGSPYSAAVGYNLKHNGIGGNYPNQEVAFSNVMVALGDVPLPYNPSGSVDSNVLSLSWSDNSGEGGALATDKIAVLIYNSDKEISMSNMEVATRSARTGSVNIPTAWNGDSVEVWLIATNSEDNSKSFYIGNFTV